MLTVIFIFIFFILLFVILLDLISISVFGKPIKKEYLDKIIKQLDDYRYVSRILYGDSLPYIGKANGFLFKYYVGNDLGVIWRFSRESRMIDECIKIKYKEYTDLFFEKK